MDRIILQAAWLTKIGDFTVERKVDFERNGDVSPTVILITMDHLELLRQKIASLRSEIADIQELNEQYRFRDQNGAEADIARRHRQERLQEIQEELVRLSQLSQKTLSIEQMREKHRSRLRLIKDAS